MGLSGAGQQRHWMNRLDAQTRAYILHSLCEGMSQRSCERIYRVSNKTVSKLFEEVGDMAIAHLATLRDLTPKRIQADELHAFVAAKKRNVPYMTSSSEGAGTQWAYLAMCADTKLIFSYQIGDRDISDATAFAKDVASKLKRTEQGSFAVRPLIVTDGLRSYDEAFDTVFGSDADRAVMVKRYDYVFHDGKRSKRKYYVGADREVRTGEADPADIHTSYIERQNCNLRMGNRRYNRKTNAFSKTLLNHERHLALWIMYHNLCWVPRPSRPLRDGNGERSGSWVKNLPAGIAAGVTDRLWEIEDLLALTDEFISERNRKGGLPEADEASAPAPEALDEGKPTHWVFHHRQQHSTKIHRAGCVNCRDGRGKKDGAATIGEWLPFPSLDAAAEAAQQMQPDRNSICKICLGSYHTLGYRHAGSSRQNAPPG